jgi:hypothetical protein
MHCDTNGCITDSFRTQARYVHGFKYLNVEDGWRRQALVAAIFVNQPSLVR